MKIYHLFGGDLDELKRMIRELKEGETLKISKIDADHLFVTKEYRLDDEWILK